MTPYRIHNYPFKTDIFTVEKDLNELGKEGYRLVTSISLHNSLAMIYYKDEKDTSPQESYPEDKLSLVKRVEILERKFREMQPPFSALDRNDR
jgi:hypothetical protein